MLSSDIMNTLRSANQAFEAGVRAGDSESARRLRELLSALDEMKLMLLADKMDMSMSKEARARAFDFLVGIMKEARR